MAARRMTDCKDGQTVKTERAKERKATLEVRVVMGERGDGWWPELG